MLMANRSVVEYFGKHERYNCGYCKSTDKSSSDGMWAHCLTPQDYQDLIDRGWRRSGKYCYKPIMNVTCCPQYTIRCEASKFKLSKSHKKILKRMKNFLLYGQVKNDNSKEQNSSLSGETHDIPMDCTHVPEFKLDQRTAAKKDVESFLGENQKERQSGEASVAGKKELFPKSETNDGKTTANPSSGSNVAVEKVPCKGPNPDKPRCRKAKDIRRERHLQKLLKSGISKEEASQIQSKQKCNEKTLEDFISEASAGNPVHKLTLRLLPSNKNNLRFLRTFEQSHALYQKYQTFIHKDPPEKCDETQFNRFLVNNPFQLRLVRAGPEHSSFATVLPQSFELFKKYQMTVHRETEKECCLETYEDFLIHTPLKFSDEDTNDYGFYSGSFHQQYWLDNKLIAVGVVDILPFCVSSVYLYYDPDYSFLSLGTYAALREIAMVRDLHMSFPELQYYYMGFYIHSCPKMKYKGSYGPAFLLCPETYIFEPIEMCVPKLAVSRYSRLEENPEMEDAEGVVHLKELMILYQRQAMTYVIYRSLNRHGDEEEDVQEYASLVGRKCYRRILLYRN